MRNSLLREEIGGTTRAFFHMRSCNMFDRAVICHVGALRFVPSPCSLCFSLRKLQASFIPWIFMEFPGFESKKLVKDSVLLSAFPAGRFAKAMNIHSFHRIILTSNFWTEPDFSYPSPLNSRAW